MIVVTFPSLLIVEIIEIALARGTKLESIVFIGVFYNLSLSPLVLENVT